MRNYLIVLLMLMSSAALASNVVGFGKVAANMTEPIEIVSGFVSVGCLIIGAVCLAASVIKYFEHRRSPLYVPMSTVVWLFIIGLLLLILPFCYMITESGIPFSVLWGGTAG